MWDIYFKEKCSKERVFTEECNTTPNEHINKTLNEIDLFKEIDEMISLYEGGQTKPS